jgi:hypothetical protein
LLWGPNLNSQQKNCALVKRKQSHSVCLVGARKWKWFDCEIA